MLPIFTVSYPSSLPTYSGTKIPAQLYLLLNPDDSQLKAEEVASWEEEEEGVRPLPKPIPK
jgi:hypothetical protein